MTTKSARPTPRRTAKPAARSAAKRRPSAKSALKPAPAIPAAPTGSKQSQLIEVLRSPAGGTIDQLTHLTGWQPHTVRGTISGTLRKRLKLNVTCVAHVYRIVGTQA
jgi:hypothetical protein